MNKKSLLELLKEKNDNMFTISGVNGMLDLLDEFSHQIEDQDETIHELQTVLKFRTNENKELYKENNRLKEVIEIKDGDRIKLVKDNEKQSIEINQLYKEREELKGQIDGLKAIIDMKDDTRIKLVEENKKLKEENEKLKLGEYTEFRKMISDLWKGVD